MRAHEIFSALPLEAASAIVGSVEADDRETYRAALQIVAGRRNLRPVFLQNKSRGQRREWLISMLMRKQNEDIAIDLLQNHLLKARRQMLISFLDTIGIGHDGEGIIANCPPEPAPEKVEEGVALLLREYPPSEVAAYLHLFVEMEPEGWPHLRSLLASNELLHLVPAPVASGQLP